MAQVNALVEPEVIEALYAAYGDGVRIDLVVRGTCCLRAGVPGVSEHIRVRSIVGRFLEHTRIYYFRNGGADEYFIGSADAMHRNLEHRVEVVAPVEQPQLKQDLQELLELQLSDQRSAWDMQPDGSYVQRMPKKTESEASSQTVQIAMAERRCRDALTRFSLPMRSACRYSSCAVTIAGA